MPFTPAGLWTPEQTLTVANNLSQAYLNAPQQAQEWGEEFYPEWHATAHHIGQATGTGLAGGSAILAHLSPSNEAEMNRIQALQLVHGGVMESSRQMGHIHKAAEATREAQSLQGSMQKAQQRGDTTAAGRFHDQLQTARAASHAHRAKAGLTGPIASVSNIPLSKAVHAREGDYSDPLESLGDIKIGDFGRMINDPFGYHRPPIDTHYHDAAINRTDIPYDIRRRLEEGGRYESMQQAHAHSYALTQALMGGGDMAPHSAYMGTIWYAQQIRKAMENPESLRSRRSSQTKLENVRRSDRFSQYLPEHYGLRPAFARVGV